MTNPVIVTAVDDVPVTVQSIDKAAVKQLAITFVKRAAVTVALVGASVVVINIVANKLKNNETA